MVEDRQHVQRITEIKLSGSVRWPRTCPSEDFASSFLAWRANMTSWPTASNASLLYQRAQPYDDRDQSRPGERRKTGNNDERLP
jgi:hypothetical protein